MNPANKFHAQRTSFGGRSYDSKAEADRSAYLQLLARANEITDLEFQRTFRLTAAEIGYRADFVYRERGLLIVEDVKGVMTDRFRLIMRLWPHYGTGTLRIVKRRGKSGWTVAKEITGPTLFNDAPIEITTRPMLGLTHRGGT